MPTHLRALKDPLQRPELRATAARLYREGHSIRAAAQRIGCSYTAARNLMLEAGVTLRPARPAARTDG